MSLWRYAAVPLTGPQGGALQRGELAGDSAADVRAALRRIGLQVVDLRPSGRKRTAGPRAPATDTAVLRGIGLALAQTLHRHLRRRRQQHRAELYDGLATMLASGLPLLEAIDSVVRSIRSRRSALRSMLVALREELRSGQSMAHAMRAHPGWFDGCEVAMVEAGQHSGSLPEVLRGLAERHEHAGELAHRLAGAMAYPAVVTMVGLGAVVFLSVRTLPSLAQVLSDAGIQIPALTARVMAFGRFVAGNWMLIGLGVIAMAAVLAFAPALATRRGVAWPAWLRRLSPSVLRRMALSRACLQLAQMLRNGVPMVEALRVLAPTTGPALRRRLLEAAEGVERGDDLVSALDDEHWFDAQFQRLLEVGQTSGDLDALLERIGRRYERQARRLIDRLAGLLEPCVILALAFLVGLVVMAAVLPLLRLQEIL
jgi:type II secretory pathway component PulF